MIKEDDLPFKTKEKAAEMILALQAIIAEKDAVIAEKNKTIEYLYERSGRDSSKKLSYLLEY